MNARAPNARDKVFIKLPRLDGRGRRIERWPLALAHVAVEGELRDDKHRPARFADRAIHLAFAVLEYAQPGDLVGKIVGIRLRIFLPDAKKHQEAPFDFTGDRSVNADFGPRDSLDDRAHGTRVSQHWFGGRKLRNIFFGCTAKGAETSCMAEKARTLTP